MKLNRTNYFQQVGAYMHIIEKDEDFEATYQFINKVTKQGKEPQNIDKSPEIRETFDLLLKNLNAQQEKLSKTKAKKAVPAKPAKPESKAKAEQPKKAAKKKEKAKYKSEQVSHIPSDIALVKKYLSLHDKDKSYLQLHAIWRAFNKAIVERKVIRDSPHHAEIAAMNASLRVALHEARDAGSLHLVIPDARLKVYEEIAHSVEKSVGVGILMEYINISGMKGWQQRAEKLLHRIEKAEADGRLKGDRYLREVRKAYTAVKAYVERETEVIDVNTYSLNGIGEIAVMGCSCDEGLDGFTRAQNAVVYKLLEEKVRNLSDEELERAFENTVAPSLCKVIAHKLMERKQLTMSMLRNPAKLANRAALAGTQHFDMETELMDMRLKKAGRNQHKHTGGSLNGIEETFVDTAPQDVQIMSARELVNKKFKTMGLTGKYKKLLGDPEPGFSAMIYGKPKQGKSTVAIDFAKELTKHGKVLYCAFEEGHGYTLQDKVKRNNADVPGLDFANKLPAHLKSYQYVFVDSVSDAGLDEQAFKQLIKSNKPTSIIGIFHATKDGKFRGGQTYAHDVDILVRVEDGVAHAIGRFAPPNEIGIAALQNSL